MGGPTSRATNRSTSGFEEGSRRELYTYTDWMSMASYPPLSVQGWSVTPPILSSSSVFAPRSRPHRPLRRYKAEYNLIHRHAHGVALDKLYQGHRDRRHHVGLRKNDKCRKGRVPGDLGASTSASPSPCWSGAGLAGWVSAVSCLTDWLRRDTLEW